MARAQAMVNVHGFQILAFSTKEQKGIRELDLALRGVNSSKTLYLEHFVTPGEKEYPTPYIISPRSLTELICVWHRGAHLAGEQ